MTSKTQTFLTLPTLARESQTMIFAELPSIRPLLPIHPICLCLMCVFCVNLKVSPGLGGELIAVLRQRALPVSRCDSLRTPKPFAKGALEEQSTQHQAPQEWPG